MLLLFTFMVSLSVTVVVIPPLMRLAPRLGLVDLPDARKVHSQIIPRCGGIGLAIGAIVPLVAWGEMDFFLSGYLAGALIILAFGIWDDIVTLNYRWKFAGQFLAVGVVMASGVVLEHLPLIGDDPAPPWLSHTVTFFLLLGVTNAVNLFDGLDGLAGGCGVMSLAALVLLGLNDPAGTVPMIAVAMIGGILGFLRYNSWPAVVFMGDAGSQLLGFTAAVLAIRLVEHANIVLSPSVVALLLGLPIMDTLQVMSQRLREGRSPFSPDKNHIHHKFLALSFHHYEAVSVVYIVQAILVVSAFMLRYEHDLLILGLYAAISAAVIGGLAYGRAKGWRLRPNPPAGTFVERRNKLLRRFDWLPDLCVAILTGGLSLFLGWGAFLPEQGLADLATPLLSIAAAAAAAQLLGPNPRRIVTRGCAYVAIGLNAYLLGGLAPHGSSLSIALWAYVVVVVPVLVLGIRVTRRALFRVTPQDLLVVLMAATVPYLPADLIVRRDLGQMVVVVAVHFYVVELLLQRDPAGSRRVGIPTCIALGLGGLRGLLGI
ncbi:MAG TPA: MraY family glycosyltransferase [Azospirillaceae bacterium]|nr:MraY family glycosyltransferase [Azospirillaceae bacterium]